MPKIWHISDTHGLHDKLIIPDADIVIHSGDASNWLVPTQNLPELKQFLSWFAALPIKHKIFVPGNHDTSLERGLISREEIKEQGITLLIDEETEIEGIHIVGSPWTPRYGNWAWMTDRATINRKWQRLPDACDILITHGPGKGILDATYSHSNKVELVGDSALMKRIVQINPKFHLFGHIHSVDDIRNTGTRQVYGMRTVFSNGSCCDDGFHPMPTSSGNIIQYSS